MIRVSPEEFAVLVKYIYEISGITLDSSKTYLIETRLGGLVEEFNCESYSEFYYKAKADRSRAMEKRVINAITTQETLWFRDGSPFEVLRNRIVPDLIDRKMPKCNGRPVPIRIWCAASSTGQEIYSIAMTLAEMLPDPKQYDVRILGTDISEAAIQAAGAGRYSKFEIDRGLSPAMLSKYFTRVGDQWRISDTIRSMANFRKFNLFDDFRTLGKFDIVFCRNVAIYFSVEDRRRIFSRIADVLEPGGTLLIGSSEYLAGVCDRFVSNRHCRAIFYTIKGDVPQAPAFAKKTQTTPAAATTRSAPSRTAPRPVAAPPATTRPSAAPRATSGSRLSAAAPVKRPAVGAGARRFG